MRAIGVLFVISGLLFILSGTYRLKSNVTSGASEASILDIVTILVGISITLSGLRLCVGRVD